MKQRHVSRAGRKAQIITEMFARSEGVEYPAAAAYSIAKMIGLAPSTHVKKMVVELADQGWLNSQEKEDFWGRKMVYYWLTDEAYKLMSEIEEQGRHGWKILKTGFEQ
jgi:hypothetical protein